MAHGTTDLPRLEDRLWGKVEKSTEGCWNWTASTRNGYGELRVSGRTEYAHRLVYRLLIGEIPDALVIRHKCDNRRCVRPDHLETGTKAENSRDMVERGRQVNAMTSRTHCSKGHPFDQENTYLLGNKRQCRACKAADNRRRRMKGSRDYDPADPAED